MRRIAQGAVMRLPLNNVWRAFPELDRFSDAQCAAYVSLARRERWGEWLAVMFGNVLLFVVLCPVIVTLGAFIFDDLALGDLGSLVATVVGTGAGVGGPLLICLIVRDMWLRRAVRLHLRGAHCPSCRYLLLGLPARDGMVRCPECGEVISLSVIGLTAADLLAPASPGSD